MKYETSISIKKSSNISKRCDWLNRFVWEKISVYENCVKWHQDLVNTFPRHQKLPEQFCWWPFSRSLHCSDSHNLWLTISFLFTLLVALATLIYLRNPVGSTWIHHTIHGLKQSSVRFCNHFIATKFFHGGLLNIFLLLFILYEFQALLTFKSL